MMWGLLLLFVGAQGSFRSSESGSNVLLLGTLSGRRGFVFSVVTISQDGGSLGTLGRAGDGQEGVDAAVVN